MRRIILGLGLIALAAFIHASVDIQGSRAIKGNLVVDGSATVGGSNVCRADGTGCPSSAGGGYQVQPATVTFQMNKGFSASTGTVTDTLTVTNDVVVAGSSVCLEDGTNCGFNGVAATNTLTSNFGIFTSTIVLPQATATTGFIQSGNVKLRMKDNSRLYWGENAGNMSGGGDYQICIGDNACANGGGTGSIGIGFYALNDDTGIGNVAIGGIGDGAQCGSSNVAVGEDSLTSCSNPPVGLNVAIGARALNALDEGYQNTAVGYESQVDVTDGIENASLGLQSLAETTSGAGNTAVGTFSLNRNALGNFGTAVGFAAGGTEGSDHSWNAGNTSTSLFLGALSGVESTGTSKNNVAAIGYQARVGCTNCMVLGNSSVSVGIGTNTPSALERFHIKGNFRVQDGSITTRSFHATFSSATATGTGGLAATYGIVGGSLTANAGFIKHFSRSLAQLATTPPSDVGQSYYCNDCTTDALCVSTQTATATWARVNSKTTACQ